MNKNLVKQTEDLIELFPTVEPPITISDEIIIQFSSANKPIPGELIAKFMPLWGDLDEYSEIVPCCQIETAHKFHILIYWKGSLLAHQYFLATINEDGNLINKKVIAGMISNGDSVRKSVATIDKDLCVYTVVGESDGKNTFDPTNTNNFQFEVLPDGTID